MNPRQIVERQARQLRAQARQIATLHAQVAYIADLAGVGDKVAQIKPRQADTDNPVQPVAEPSTEGPAVDTTDSASTPSATEDVRSTGETSGANDGVPPEATADVTSVGEEMPAPAPADTADVEAPVSGTTTHDGDGKTEVEIRAGTPADNGPMFTDLTGSKQPDSPQVRTFAALRLARRRIAAGLAQGEDLDVAAQIEASGQPTDAIIHEAETLEQVAKAAARRQPPPQHQQAPRRSPVQTRQVPSMATAAAATPAPNNGQGQMTLGSMPSQAPTDDEFLW